MDRLSRLTDTYYAETGTHESTTLDGVGNREAYTSRGGEQIDYTLANPANQYATIGGANIDYDPAGNLSTDEAGRSYFYDERNRLIEVWAPGGTTLLASYTYDALGRRTSFADPVVGVTTYYYYAGKQVIEEYIAAGTRLRYHINGTQYIDEQIATYDEATGEFTYYLAGEQFSVIGTGNADGLVIEARGYSVGGDFSGAGACADFDADGDVDADDFAVLEACFSGPDVPLAAGCEAADLDGDGDVDGMDYARFQLCMSGEGVAPPPGCEGTPPSGSFALHGRPVDVLSDGLVLIPVRARTYDPRHGRWLQRDPTGYADGPNLYEAFRGNATAFTDPMGTEIWSLMMRGGPDSVAPPTKEEMVAAFIKVTGGDVAWVDPAGYAIDKHAPVIITRAGDAASAIKDGTAEFVDESIRGVGHLVVVVWTTDPRDLASAVSSSVGDWAGTTATEARCTYVLFREADKGRAEAVLATVLNGLESQTGLAEDIYGAETFEGAVQAFTKKTGQGVALFYAVESSYQLGRAGVQTIRGGATGARVIVSEAPSGGRFAMVEGVEGPGLSIAARQKIVAARTAEHVALRSETAAVLREARATGMTPALRAQLRGLGGRLGWAEETQLVRMTGQGTRAWSAAEMSELLQNGRVAGYTPHRLCNVAKHPWMAGNPNNIMMVERWTEHGLMHGGNTHMPTRGPLINRSQMMIDASTGR